jgi:hypothetical protein
MTELSDILPALPKLPDGLRWQIVPDTNSETPLRVEIQEPDGSSWRAVRSQGAPLDTGAIERVAKTLAREADASSHEEGRTSTPTGDERPLSDLFPEAPEGLRWQVVPTGVDADPIHVELQEPDGASWRPVAEAPAALAVDYLRLAAEEALRSWRGVPDFPQLSDVQAAAWVNEVDRVRETVKDPKIPYDPEDHAWWTRNGGAVIDVACLTGSHWVSIRVDGEGNAASSIRVLSEA